MTTISLADWGQSPPIIVGQDERRQVTIAALTDIGTTSADFLLYELDRAKVVPDRMVPSDVVRLGSVVRYKETPGEERIIKLVLPSDAEPAGSYRLSVTSSPGAALLGLKAGATMTWIDGGGAVRRLKLLTVVNPAPDDWGPDAA